MARVYLALISVPLFDALVKSFQSASPAKPLEV